MMETFTKGERVRFVEKGYEEEGWTGREGTVTDHFCEYGEHKVGVLFDGDDRVRELREESFEHLRDTYVIENMAEGSTTAVMELTPSEVALIERMIEQFENTTDTYAPTMTINKYTRMDGR